MRYPSSLSLPVRFVLVAWSFLILTCFAAPAWSQNVVLGAAVNSARDADEPPPADPFAEQLLASAQRGNQQTGIAIESLAKTGRWEYANRLLEQLRRKPPAAAGLAEIQQQIEPAIFLELKLNDSISEPAKSMLDQIAAAGKAKRQSPKRLQDAIGRLDDDSIDHRLDAARVLIEGGSASIVALVAASVAADPPAERATILRALLRQGRGGVDALRQLALYGSPEARRGALESLARVDARTYTVDLLAAYHGARSTPTEREVADRNLRRIYGRIPDRRESIERLIADLDQNQAIARQIDNDDDVQIHWGVVGDGSKVEPIRTRALYAAYRKGADAVVRLQNANALSDAVTTKCLIADLSYRVLIDPDWGDSDQTGAIFAAYGTSLDASILSESLQSAIDSDDHGAAVGLIRLIDADTTTGSDPYLRVSSRGLSPLVAATSSPITRVRYESALTAASLASGAPYPGSSLVKQTLSEMTRLRDLPTAVLVETRPEVIAPIEQALAQLGFSSQMVQNVGQLQRCLDQGRDIQLIVSKSQLSDLAPIEMVDLVRRTHRSRQIPIVFYGDHQVARQGLDPDLHAADSDRWTGPLEWVEAPSSPAAYVGILDRIARKRRLPPLAATDRQQFRREASALLGEIASTP